MQSKKKTILAVAALVVIAAVLLLVWRAVTPKGEAGEKTITVQVLHKGGEERVFTLETGEAYLGAVLTAEGVVEDNQGPYGLYMLTVDGETVPATADKLSDLLRLLTAMGPGRMGPAPAEPPRITIDYGDGTVLEVWEVTLVNPSNDWTEGPYLRCTFPGGRRFGYDTDRIPMSTLLRLLA